MNIDRLAALRALCDAATPGPWYTVEPPWRADYYGQAFPTYVIAGSDDPHAGKPVLDAMTLEHGDEDTSEADHVAQSDADLGFAAEARTALPECLAHITDLLAEGKQLRDDINQLRETVTKPCGTYLGNLPAQFGQLYKFMQHAQEGTQDKDAATTWEEWAKDLQARFGLIYRDMQEGSD